jgi:hypothetical protein
MVEVRDLGYRAAVGPGAVDERNQRAKTLVGFAEHPRDLSLLRHVRLDHDRLAARSADLAQERLGSLALGPIVDGDPITLLRREPGGRGADSARPAPYQEDAGHRRLSRCMERRSLGALVRPCRRPARASRHDP